jgi:hypothetical protein
MLMNKFSGLTVGNAAIMESIPSRWLDWRDTVSVPSLSVLLPCEESCQFVPCMHWVNPCIACKDCALDEGKSSNHQDHKPVSDWPLNLVTLLPDQWGDTPTLGAGEVAACNSTSRSIWSRIIITPVAKHTLPHTEDKHWDYWDILLGRPWRWLVWCYQL